jgi:cell division protein FtsI/penicillin-binding protein 2
MGQESKKWLRFRIATLLGLFVVLFIALMTRAFQLQVLSGTALKGIAARQHTSFLTAHPERGIIFDRNGEKLAASILTDSVCADPSKIRDIRKTAQSIASVLGIDPAPLQRRMTASKHFCWLARQISPEQAARVETVKADGVFLIKEPKRFYPNGNLAGHLIGFVGVDSVGLEGLEMLYDEYLKGTPEKLVWGRDAKGKRLYPRTEKVASDSKASSNLILTIDGRIQHLVETKLREAVKDKGAKAATPSSWTPRPGRSWPWPTSPVSTPTSSNGRALPTTRTRPSSTVTTQVPSSNPSSSPRPWRSVSSGKGTGSSARTATTPWRTGSFTRPSASGTASLRCARS